MAALAPCCLDDAIDFARGEDFGEVAPLTWYLE